LDLAGTFTIHDEEIRTMQTIQVTVPFKEGLHARPATELVKVCMTIKSDITLV